MLNVTYLGFIAINEFSDISNDILAEIADLTSLHLKREKYQNTSHCQHNHNQGNLLTQQIGPLFSDWDLVRLTASDWPPQLSQSQWFPSCYSCLTVDSTAVTCWVIWSLLSLERNHNTNKQPMNSHSHTSRLTSKHPYWFTRWYTLSMNMCMFYKYHTRHKK